MDKTEQIIEAVRKIMFDSVSYNPDELKHFEALEPDLESAISEIVEKDPWISVEDRLPEIIRADNGSVNCILIYYDHDASPGSQYSIVNTAWANGHIENANKGMFKRWFTWYKYLPPLLEQEG